MQRAARALGAATRINDAVALCSASGRTALFEKNLKDLAIHDWPLIAHKDQTMNSKVSYAVAAILSGASYAAAAAEASAESAGASTDAIAEVTVTAQRRTENMQDVPISMQALTAQNLQQLNIATFDDYIKFLPNVTVASNGPGQNEVFMRGLSAGSQPSQGINPDSCRIATSTSTPPISIASRFWRVRRARSSAPAPRRA